VAQLYPRALGSFYFVSQDYGVGILTLHQRGKLGPRIYPSRTGWSSPKSKSRYDRQPVNQYVLVSSPLGIKGFHPKEFQSNIRIGTLRRNLFSYHWEDCMWSMQCKVEFGYQLSICSGTKENYGKPWSSWPVAGPSGCKLTSSHQSGIKYASPNTSPYLCFCFFFSLKTFTSCFYKNLYLYIIWISTKPCRTPAEGMNAYWHKYAYNYTYICNCDFLIIGKFGSSLYFVKKLAVIRGSLLIQ
jgi:hypothetical protein